MGALRASNFAAVAAWLCGHAHWLVTYAHGHFHRAAADGAGLCPGLRPRGDRTAIADAPAATVGRMVLRHLSGTDGLAAGHPLFRATALSPARDNRPGRPLFRPGLVAGAAFAGHNLRAVGRAAGGIHRIARRGV